MAEILSIKKIHTMVPVYLEDRVIFQCRNCDRRTQSRIGPGNELPFIIKPGDKHIHHNY